MSVKKLFLILLVIFVSGCVCSTAPRLSPRKIAQMSDAESAGQLILVAATGISDSRRKSIFVLCKFNCSLHCVAVCICRNSVCAS